MVRTLHCSVRPKLERIPIIEFENLTDSMPKSRREKSKPWIFVCSYIHENSLIFAPHVTQSNSATYGVIRGSTMTQSKISSLRLTNCPDTSNLPVGIHRLIFLTSFLRKPASSISWSSVTEPPLRSRGYMPLVCTH